MSIKKAIRRKNFENNDEVLKRDIRLLVSSRNPSIRTFASGIGYTHPVVSAWLSGTYKGDNDAVARAARRYLRSQRMTQKDQQRILKIFALLDESDSEQSVLAVIVGQRLRE